MKNRAPQESETTGSAWSRIDEILEWALLAALIALIALAVGNGAANDAFGWMTSWFR